MSNTFNIFYGVWTDYTDNTCILTLSTTSSAYLQAAIPIFVTFVGSQLWNIIQMILYWCYFRADYDLRLQNQPHSFLAGHLRQRLVLLRNSGGGFSTLVDMA